MHDYANLSLWTAITNNPGKDLLFPRSPNLAQKPLYLVGTVLKTFLSISTTLFIFRYIEEWKRLRDRRVVNGFTDSVQLRCR